MAKEKKYQRGIFEENLKKSLTDGNLAKMLKVVNTDEDLVVYIREDYLSVYYKGGCIGKISSEKSITFDKAYFEPCSGDEVKKQQRDELIKYFKNAQYHEYFNKAKNVMDRWSNERGKKTEEKYTQQELALNNKYGMSDYTILDLEYQVSSESRFKSEYEKKPTPRFDIIAINKDGKVCVIELKKGVKALRGNSGLDDHYKSYQQSIGRKPQLFVEEMCQLLKQKKAFGLIDQRAKITEDEPEFIFAYAFTSTDEKGMKKEKDSYNEEVRVKKLEMIKKLELLEGEYKLIDKSCK